MAHIPQDCDYFQPNLKDINSELMTLKVQLDESLSLLTKPSNQKHLEKFPSVLSQSRDKIEEIAKRYSSLENKISVTQPFQPLKPADLSKLKKNNPGIIKRQIEPQKPITLHTYQHQETQTPLQFPSISPSSSVDLSSSIPRKKSTASVPELDTIIKTKLNPQFFSPENSILSESSEYSSLLSSTQKLDSTKSLHSNFLSLSQDIELHSHNYEIYRNLKKEEILISIEYYYDHGDNSEKFFKTANYTLLDLARIAFDVHPHGKVGIILMTTRNPDSFHSFEVQIACRDSRGEARTFCLHSRAQTLCWPSKSQLHQRLIKFFVEQDNIGTFVDWEKVPNNRYHYAVGEDGREYPVGLCPWEACPLSNPAWKYQSQSHQSHQLQSQCSSSSESESESSLPSSPFTQSMSKSLPTRTRTNMKKNKSNSCYFEQDIATSTNHNIQWIFDFRFPYVPEKISPSLIPSPLFSIAHFMFPCLPLPHQDHLSVGEHSMNISRKFNEPHSQVEVEKLQIFKINEKFFSDSTLSTRFHPLNFGKQQLFSTYSLPIMDWQTESSSSSFPSPTSSTSSTGLSTSPSRNSLLREFDDLMYCNLPAIMLDPSEDSQTLYSRINPSLSPRSGGQRERFPLRHSVKAMAVKYKDGSMEIKYQVFVNPSIKHNEPQHTSHPSNSYSDPPSSSSSSSTSSSTSLTMSNIFHPSSYGKKTLCLACPASSKVFAAYSVDLSPNSLYLPKRVYNLYDRETNLPIPLPASPRPTDGQKTPTPPSQSSSSSFFPSNHLADRKRTIITTSSSSSMTSPTSPSPPSPSSPPSYVNLYFIDPLSTNPFNSSSTFPTSTLTSNSDPQSPLSSSSLSIFQSSSSPSSSSVPPLNLSPSLSPSQPLSPTITIPIPLALDEEEGCATFDLQEALQHLDREREREKEKERELEKDREKHSSSSSTSVSSSSASSSSSTRSILEGHYLISISLPGYTPYHHSFIRFRSLLKTETVPITLLPASSLTSSSPSFSSSLSNNQKNDNFPSVEDFETMWTLPPLPSSPPPTSPPSTLPPLISPLVEESSPSVQELGREKDRERVRDPDMSVDYQQDEFEN